MIIYADTSALAKLVWVEDGTTIMQSAFESAELTGTAIVAYAELRAALGMSLRDGRIPATQRGAMLAVVERLWSRLSQVLIDDPLVRHAGELAERFRLRGYDAVHLAALSQFGQPGDVTFACWDRQLARAASDLGYEVVPSR